MSEAVTIGLDMGSFEVEGEGLLHTLINPVRDHERLATFAIYFLIVQMLLVSLCI